MVVAEASGVKLRSPHHLCGSGGAYVLHAVNKQDEPPVNGTQSSVAVGKGSP